MNSLRTTSTLAVIEQAVDRLAELLEEHKSGGFEQHLSLLEVGTEFSDTAGTQTAPNTLLIKLGNVAYSLPAA